MYCLQNQNLKLLNCLNFTLTFELKETIFLFWLKIYFTFDIYKIENEKVYMHMYVHVLFLIRILFLALV